MLKDAHVTMLQTSKYPSSSEQAQHTAINKRPPTVGIKEMTKDQAKRVTERKQTNEQNAEDLKKAQDSKDPTSQKTQATKKAVEAKDLPKAPVKEEIKAEPVKTNSTSLN